MTSNSAPLAASPGDQTQAGPPGLTLVLGAGGGLGAALLQTLRADNQSVMGLGRLSPPALDYLQPATVAQAAAHVQDWCAAQGTALRQLIVATGFLHGAASTRAAPLMPERRLADIDPEYLSQVFAVNTIGPALVMKHFLPLLPRQGRCVAAFLSAKVGSIGDNALGGWYGYRASKAALNQLVKTASIELTRHNPGSICVALHPGTVATDLSAPFAKTALRVRPATEAARDLAAVLTALTAAQTGGFFDYQGQVLPW
jgi:NAD(P)-dependent dehydrogenase (short-subunit alcohol dehydrogenase family)